MSFFKSVVGKFFAIWVAVWMHSAFAQSDSLQVLDLDSSPVNGAVSEFDNHAARYTVPTHLAAEDYEDTEFGELLYNEASVATRLEVLRLLSKDTPSMIVFLQAISMGLGIDDVLEAAVRYEPSRGREFAQTAISILPLVTDTVTYDYGTYEVNDLDRDDEGKPYQVKQVLDKFFDDRKVLVPSPDWIEGQFHFNASAAELKGLMSDENDVAWYDSKSSINVDDRPVFVSLY